jgi:hypothetical protein
MSRRRTGSRRGGHGRRDPVPLWPRLFANRYDPQSRWVTFADVWENLKAMWFSWTNRVPPGSRLLYRNGRIVGYSTQWRGKR